MIKLGHVLDNKMVDMKLNNKKLLWKKPSKVSDEILLTTHQSDYINLVKSSFPKNRFPDFNVLSTDFKILDL